MYEKNGRWCDTHSKIPIHTTCFDREVDKGDNNWSDQREDVTNLACFNGNIHGGDPFLQVLQQIAVPDVCGGD